MDTLPHQWGCCSSDWLIVSLWEISCIKMEPLLVQPLPVAPCVVHVTPCAESLFCYMHLCRNTVLISSFFRQWSAGKGAYLSTLPDRENIDKSCRWNLWWASWSLDEALGSLEKKWNSSEGSRANEPYFPMYFEEQLHISLLGLGQRENSWYSLLPARVLHAIFTCSPANSCKNHECSWGRFLPAKGNGNWLMSSESAEGGKKAHTEHLTALEAKPQT